MKWRVVMEVIRADGAVHVYEIGGGAAVEEYSPGTVGLTLAEGSSCSLDYSTSSFRHRRRIIAGADGDARGAGHRGPSKTSGLGVFCLCSAP